MLNKRSIIDGRNPFMCNVEKWPKDTLITDLQFFTISRCFTISLWP